jgi:hypothetical protein
MKGTPD